MYYKGEILTTEKHADGLFGPGKVKYLKGIQLLLFLF